MTGLIVVAAAAVASAALAILLRVANGRFRNTASAERLTEDDLGSELGSRATLVQFSTVFCAPCRATRTLLRDVSSRLDDVAFVDIDAEAHLDLVRRFDVIRTPTVFVLNRDGEIVRRASGQPKRVQIDAVLAGI
jgi:thiol-disulfide isomerase/thioredoxin